MSKKQSAPRHRQGQLDLIYLRLLHESGGPHFERDFPVCADRRRGDVEHIIAEEERQRRRGYAAKSLRDGPIFREISVSDSSPRGFTHRLLLASSSSPKNGPLWNHHFRSAAAFTLHGKPRILDIYITPLLRKSHSDETCLECASRGVSREICSRVSSTRIYLEPPDQTVDPDPTGTPLPAPPPARSEPITDPLRDRSVTSFLNNTVIPNCPPPFIFGLARRAFRLPRYRVAFPGPEPPLLPLLDPA